MSPPRTIVGSQHLVAQESREMPFDQAKEEIEERLSGVQWALEGAETAPFLSLSALKHPPDVVKYLGDATRDVLDRFRLVRFRCAKPRGHQIGDGQA